MHDGTWARRLISCVVLTAWAATAASAVGIESLGVLPGDFGSAAIDLSDDGEVVIGTSDGDPFFWRRGVGLNAMPTQLFGEDYRLNAISGDGATLVGTFDPGRRSKPLLWQLPGVPRLLERQGEEDEFIAISADGRAGVGHAEIGNNFALTRWDFENGLSVIGRYPPGNATRAIGISDDGSTILAEAFDVDRRPFPVRVDAANVFTPLPAADGGFLSGNASGISGDGSTVVGAAGFDGFLGRQAFRQVGNELAEPLGVSGFAEAVSGDGSVVVGHGSINGSEGFKAFVWSEQTGPVLLYDLLTSNGVDLSGWLDLQSADAISPDGRWLIGTGRINQFERRAFLVELPTLVPEPGVATSVAFATLALLRRTRRRTDAGVAASAWSV